MPAPLSASKLLRQGFGRAGTLALKAFDLKPEDVWPNCAFVEIEGSLYAVFDSLLRVDFTSALKLTQPILNDWIPSCSQMLPALRSPLKSKCRANR